MRTEFTAGQDDGGRRLETVLRRLLPDVSLGTLHKALRKGDIRLRGAKAAPESRVEPGDTIAIWDALLTGRPVRTLPALPASSLPLDWIVWEGDDWLVINKPSGLVVHRGSHPQLHQEPALDDRVRAYLHGSQGPSLGFRPGPLHRLDRETSGLVVFSRTLRGAQGFSEALVQRRVSKTYLAVLTGRLEAPAETRDRLQREAGVTRVGSPEEGAEAASRFTPLAWTENLTLAEVDLGTGRTHQIRVHAQTLGHPLAGDSKYQGGATPSELGVPWLLHAWKLTCDLFPPQTAPLAPVQAQWLQKKFKFFP